MTEIAAGIAILISLAALWLANQAYRQVADTFEEFTNRLIKQVRDVQNEFAERSERIRGEFSGIERTLQSIESHEHEFGQKLLEATKRIESLERKLTELRDSIPPQYRRHQVKKPPETPEPPEPMKK